MLDIAQVIFTEFYFGSQKGKEFLQTLTTVFLARYKETGIHF